MFFLTVNGRETAVGVSQDWNSGRQGLHQLVVRSEPVCLIEKGVKVCLGTLLTTMISASFIQIKCETVSARGLPKFLEDLL
jgi:hypothetical protein